MALKRKSREFSSKRNSHAMVGFPANRSLSGGSWSWAQEGRVIGKVGASNPTTRSEKIKASKSLLLIGREAAMQLNRREEN